jgi:hypothetical protein
VTSRAALVLVLLIVGCTDDVPTMRVSTIAMTSVELSPPDDRVPDAFGHYRWDVSQSPDGLVVAPPAAQTATVTVTPPRRGVYVYDRWFVGEATEQLSCHVIVTVSGARPVARVGGPMMVAVGEAATFDGSSSSSSETRVVGYQWRLAVRPEVSSAALAEANEETLTFVPDVAGEFKIELRVFDGQLWSTPTSATLTAR